MVSRYNDFTGMTVLSRKGFTLVELLVVITILAILSVIALISYGSVTSQARDTKRKGDLQALATALELYKKQGIYILTGSEACSQTNSQTFSEAIAP